MQTVLLSFSVRNSSVSEFFVEIANRLSKNSNVIVVTDCIQPHPYCISSSIQIVKRPSLGPHHPKVLQFMNSLIRKNKPSIIIGNFSAVGPLMILGFLNRVPTRIAWCHSISSQFLKKRPFFDRKRLIYSLATNIFANSISTKEDLINNFKINPRRIEVFYNALKRPEKNNSLYDPLQLTYAGRMDKSKGVETLLYAMSSIVKYHPMIKLKLIGGYINSEPVLKMQELIRDLDLEEHVDFLGFQPRKIVLEEFSKSYLAVVPSVIEAFGYVVIESFAMKTPVVGSNTTGISEIIRDGVDGLLFEPENPDDLAAKISKMLEEPTLREKFSLNCFQRFEEKFELCKVTSDIVNRIESINSGDRK